MVEVAAGLLLFKNYIVITVPVTVLLLIAVNFCTRRFSFEGRFRWVYACFYGRTNWEMVFLGASWLQFMFLVSAALTGTEAEMAHLVFLLLLVMVKLAAQVRILLFFRDVLNTALVFAAMTANGILLGYLKETRSNHYVAVIVVCLNLFLVLYGLYFFFRDLEEMEKGRR